MVILLKNDAKVNCMWEYVGSGVLSGRTDLHKASH